MSGADFVQLAPPSTENSAVQGQGEQADVPEAW